MSEESKPKSPPPAKDADPTNWKNFWWRQLRDMKIRTGIGQWEKYQEKIAAERLMGKEKTLQEVRLLIAEMTIECEKTPYGWVKREVIQRVIQSEITDDPEFIGLSVKWVRKALNKWWAIHGDRIIIGRQKQLDEEAEKNKKPDTMNPHEDIHVTVENYRKRYTLEGAQISSRSEEIRKMKKEEIEKKGREWKSDLERKAVKREGSSPTLPEYIKRECVLRAGSEFYAKRQQISLRPFRVDGYGPDVFAESQKDANEIHANAEILYPEAMENFKKFGKPF